MIPQGTAFVDSNRDRWYVRGGKRYAIKTSNVFRSWRFPSVFSISSSELERETAYGGVLGIRPGTIAFSFFDGGFWYISDSGRHKIGSLSFLKRAGVKWYDATWFSKSEMDLHEDLGVIE